MYYKTQQEDFWAGDFGNHYIIRNKSYEHLASSISMYSKIVSKTKNIKSVIEFGSNIGINLEAIKMIIPRVELSAIEINENAIKILNKKENIKVYHKSIFDFEPDYQRDLVLIRGVLIHINPEYLNKVYEIMYKTTNRYICLAEYYNPKPVSIEYREERDKLFKRDFAGELMDNYPDLKLVDYGFVYHRDNNFPQDDITWFLLEKITK